MNDHSTDSPAGRRLLVCNCERTMTIDGAKLAKVLGIDGPVHVHHQLCRSEIDRFRAAHTTREPLLVACTQEAPLFREIAEEGKTGDGAEAEAEKLAFVNIRERAGWSEAGSDVHAKMAALIAEAGHKSRPAGLKTLVSDGQCLVYGSGGEAIEVANRLSDRLSVSLLLGDAAGAEPQSVCHYPIFKGRISRVAGALGDFEVTVDGYAEMVPSSRAELAFTLERDGAKSRCDLILDLSGGAPLVSDAERRDGYFRADPRHPAAVARAMFEVVDFVGEFEKPLYVTYDPGLCAHARSGKVGCSNCIDHCPTSAIAPDGDNVAIDPNLCGGCGNCSAHCPTGAVQYAFPDARDLITRARLLLDTYLGAGGTSPVLLIHGERHGGDLIAAMARHGRGLPANVLPLTLYTVTQVGHDALAAMLAAGAARIILLASPEQDAELPALAAEVALTASILDGLGYSANLVRIISESDPEALETILHDLERTDGLRPAAFELVENKRERARLALAKLHAQAPRPVDRIALGDGAPYGRIRVDRAGCTLCLACVGCCPTGALGDNAERPQLSFSEAACVQCGLCVATCPEHVISREPGYDFTNAGLSPTVLNEEEPFECISCGRPFATKSMIERVTSALRGKNPMFQDDSQVRLIQMCDDCRILAISDQGGNPMAMGERPKIRTTDDYLAEEAEAEGEPSDDLV